MSQYILEFNQKYVSALLDRPPAISLGPGNDKVDS